MNVSYRGLVAVSNIIQRDATLAYRVKRYRRQEPFRQFRQAEPR
ncbi:hypothetical protein [Nonomuraea sp. NPDC003709]